MDYPDQEPTLAAPVLQSTPPGLTMRVGDRSYTVEPADAPITIGREFPAQVQINDQRISRTHLRVEVHAGRWVAFDHSSNGAFVNGARQQVTSISDGLTIHLGHPQGIPVSFSFAPAPARAQTVVGPAPEATADDDMEWSAGEGESTDPGIARAGAAVAARRRELDISQRTLAKEKVINAGALISFEKGRSWPRKSTQEKLEQLLGWQPGTIARFRQGQVVESGPATEQSDVGERTELLSNTVEAPAMAEVVRVALESIKSRVDSLPEASDAAFSDGAAGILDELRKLERAAANAARSAKAAPDVVLVLSAVRKTYRELMMRAARSARATTGQKLFAARNRADLTIEEAATAAGVPAATIADAEADRDLDPADTSAVKALLDSLTRG
jgi:transcriptional regulator with XRE-family HTH domain